MSGFTLLNISSNQTTYQNQNDELNSITPNLITTGKIEIFDNDGFVALDLPGSGTQNDPYLIENRYITGVSQHMIYIIGTTAHVIIQNNYMNGKNAVDYGIHLIGVENIQILNNQIFNNSQNGIHLTNSKSISIVNNLIYNNTFNGIFLDSGSNFNLISNNELTKNNYNGLEMKNSNSNTILNNLFYSNTHNGSILINSKSNNFENNIFLRNMHNALALVSSNENNISNNNFKSHSSSIGRQISLENSNQNIIFKNIINASNSSSLYNFKSDFTEFTFNNVISFTISFIQTEFRNSTGLIINYNHFTGGYVNIYFNSVSNSVIKYNSISGVIHSGIFVTGVSDIEIHGNRVIGNGNYGIAYGNPTGPMLNSIITSNYVQNFVYNIVLYGVPGGAVEPLIQSNTLVDAVVYGLFLGDNNNDSKVYWNNLINKRVDFVGIYDMTNTTSYSNNYYKGWPNTPIEINGTYPGEVFDNSPLTNPHLLSGYPDLISVHEDSILSNSVSLEWNRVSSSHNHSVHYNIYYSPNNGMTWFDIALNHTSNTILWDTTLLQDGGNYLIKIEAVNSVILSNYYISDNFQINNLKITETFIETVTQQSTVTGTEESDEEGFFGSLPFPGISAVFTFVMLIIIIKWVRYKK
jgi:parallel beta-helix repeat protein